MCLAEVSVTEQVLQKISKFPEIPGKLSMRKQCVPGSFFSAHAREPGNEAIVLRAQTKTEIWCVNPLHAKCTFIFIRDLFSLREVHIYMHWGHSSKA